MLRRAACFTFWVEWTRGGPTGAKRRRTAGLWLRSNGAPVVLAGLRKKWRGSAGRSAARGPPRRSCRITRVCSGLARLHALDGLFDVVPAIGAERATAVQDLAQATNELLVALWETFEVGDAGLGQAPSLAREKRENGLDKDFRAGGRGTGDRPGGPKVVPGRPSAVGHHGGFILLGPSGADPREVLRPVAFADLPRLRQQLVKGVGQDRIAQVRGKQGQNVVRGVEARQVLAKRARERPPFCLPEWLGLAGLRAWEASALRG